MLNIQKAITVSRILLNNLIFWSLILALFYLSGNLYAQTPLRGFRSNQPALDFPPRREFDPGHPLEPRESGISPSAHKTKSLVSEANISENVELVGATGGAVYDVFVLDNYAYICAGGTLTILDVSAPSNPIKVEYVALPGLAYGVYVQGGFAYVANYYSGLLQIIDNSSARISEVRKDEDAHFRNR